ncbi:hypothetical protein ACN42_g10830 [Penicillium freii]|uniref:Protein HRI1 n=1 Tax=Penicillium freii TaxID=48697 RepID=A0A101M9B3_PENFR|nr:hypothetical protein ACN42_g10830 [Penicillium freii]
MSATGAQLGSSCGFSTRISLRWVPEVPEETTDTIVLSVGEWFLDLRMDKKSGGIDWAMAGTRIEENPKGIPLKVIFTRELDSLNEIGIRDIGNFSPRPDGTDLESGEMPRTDLPEKALKGRKKGISWILESDDAPLALGEQEGQVTITKIFMGRIWGTYLAFQQTQTHSSQKDESGVWSVKRSGSEVSARREEWSSKWEEKYLVGPDGAAVPSMKNGYGGEGMGTWRIPGEKVFIQGKSFIVRAFEEIQ